MNIALDVMGGDHAPISTIEGAILALPEMKSGDHITLVGKKSLIESTLLQKGGNPKDFIIVNAKDVISMGEHPTKAIAKKPKSSVVVGYKLLKNNEADAFISAGNTGAMMVGAMFSIKSVEGIIRPTICSYLPKESGKFGVIADVGANADCKPDVLVQFGTLACLYARHLLSIENPRVGLMNLGEEEQKGSLLTQAAYQLFKINNNINFIGNLEGRDLFNNKADVVICDGFTGNVILKVLESMYDMLRSRDFLDSFFQKFNYENIGGSPILGINGVALVGHGVSSGNAIKNMILRAKDMVEVDIVSKIKEVFN